MGGRPTENQRGLEPITHEPTIARLPEERRLEALHCLFSHIGEGDRLAVIEDFLSEFQRFKFSWDGLLGVFDRDQVLGVGWTQIHAGHTAALAYPRFLERSAETMSRRLLDAGLQFSQRQQARFAQCVLETHDSDQASTLESVGFLHAAELVFLVCGQDQFADKAPATDFLWESVLGVQTSRLAQVVQRTYVETLDCPLLNGWREADDVVEGYLQASLGRTENWWLLKSPTGDLGCLLLSEHVDERRMELLYMGLVPEARGRNLGMLLVRFAQWQARQRGMKEIVLACDGKNQPALSTYQTAGFQSWGHRHVFLRRLTQDGLPRMSSPEFPR